MQLKPEEISKIIRAQIKHYENIIEQSEVGTVILVGDGIARASGLEKCMAGELLQFENGEYGMAQNLEENTVSIVLLGSDVGIKEGSTTGWININSDNDNKRCVKKIAFSGHTVHSSDMASLKIIGDD